MQVYNYIIKHWQLLTVDGMQTVDASPPPLAPGTADLVEKVVGPETLERPLMRDRTPTPPPAPPPMAPGTPE